MLNNQRLGVAALHITRRGISDMSYGHFAAPQRRQALRIKHLIYKSQIPVIGYNPSVVYRYAAALLAAVLKCVKSKIYL